MDLGNHIIIKKILAGAGIAAGVYIAMRYFVPLILPFLLALVIVLFLNPFITKLHKRLHVGKGLLAGTAVGFLIVVLAALLCFFSVNVFGSMGMWVGRMNLLQEDFTSFVTECCCMLEVKLGINAGEIEQYVLDNVNIFVENMQVEIMPKIMGRSIGYAKTIFSFVACAVVTIISVILLAKDFDGIKEKVKELEWYRKIKDITVKIAHLCKVYVKAQLMIMTVIIIISSLGLWMLGSGSPLGFGLLTGLLDAFPFIGSGIVLIPYSLYFVITGELLKAAGAILIYVICSFTREFLEPKLIGEKVGVFPIVILMSVYIGIRLYGVGGIVLGPLSMVLIVEFFKLLKVSF